MAARYHPLYDGLWNDDAFDAQGDLPEASFEERAFFAFLCSNHRLRPSGIYRASDAQLALDATLPVGRVKRYMVALEQRRRIVRDGLWLFVRGYFGRQPKQAALLDAVKSDLAACSSPVIHEAFRAKYGGFTVRTERSLHDALYFHIESALEFLGLTVLSVRRDVRIGSGYADLVLALPEGREAIVELKTTRADTGTLRQIQRYMEGHPGALGIILATGQGEQLTRRQLTGADIALVLYNGDGHARVAVPSSLVKDGVYPIPLAKSTRFDTADPVKSLPPAEQSRAVQSRADQSSTPRARLRVAPAPPVVEPDPPKVAVATGSKEPAPPLPTPTAEEMAEHHAKQERALTLLRTAGFTPPTDITA